MVTDPRNSSHIHLLTRLSKLSTITAIALILAAFGGCDTLNEEEAIPAYLYIEAVQLQTSAGEGSNQHDVTDVWVSVGSQLIGVFPLPATIPVLETGDKEVTVFAGIIQNGVGALRDIYPFYSRYTFTTTLQSGVTDTIVPTYNYKEDINFLFIEDFETSNIISDDLDGNLDTKFTATTEVVFEGAKSALATLEGDSNYIEVGTNLSYEIAEGFQNAYLELHYRSDINFEIGIVGRSSLYFDKFFKVGAFETGGEWRKMYVDFTNDVKLMQANTADEFQIVFRAISVDPSIEPASIYLDNIKLIYR